MGGMLGLVNVRESLKDFDEDELRASSTDTSRTTNFLTELGTAETDETDERA